jgi:hypothetical protein
MNGIYDRVAVWCRPVLRRTTWYSSKDMKLWYVVHEKDSKTVTDNYYNDSLSSPRMFFNIVDLKFYSSTQLYLCISLSLS